jgi:hypothetical protein
MLVLLILSERKLTFAIIFVTAFGFATPKDVEYNILGKLEKYDISIQPEYLLW